MRIRRFFFLFAIASAILLCGRPLYGQIDTVQSKMSADSAAAVQAGADSYVMSCWEGFDYSRFNHLDMDAESEIISNAERLENKLAVYFWVLKMASDSVAQISVNKLMDNVAASCGRGEYRTGYDKVMEAAERYFYTPDSPYYSEKRLLLFLNHKIGRTDIDEIERARSKYLVYMIRRNPVGYAAENFDYYDVDGNLQEFWDLFWRYTIHITKPACNGSGDGTVEYKYEKTLASSPVLVVFFTSDCRDCRKGIKALKEAAVIQDLVKDKKLRVLAICTEGNLSSVSSLIPKDWIAGSDRGFIARNRLYVIRHSPSVYLMDGEATVLLRDASVSEALDFLLEK
jgi:hypothetical protein